ncbi:CBS domain-containing protein [Spongiibacter marinus]|uniref:CBS domain-containing protein n=1 Tax=Spongiibacter marinus TaxID=354246 RepID=UPI0035632A5A
MSNSIRVRDIMTSPAPFVRMHTPLGEVVDTLLRSRVMGLPVLDDSDRVVGFVSEQDCIHSMLVSSYHCEGVPNVDDVMHNEVLAVEAEQNIVDLAQNMGKNKPKLYPVIEDGKLLGLITRSAILSALWENRAHCDSQ